MEPTDLIDPCIPMPHGTQSKIYRDGKGKVLKDMRGGKLHKVRKEYDLQCAVYTNSHRVPRPIMLVDHYILMEDLGIAEGITDLDLCLNEAEHLLDGLEKSGVLHNDLQPGNIIVRNNIPYAIDFGWARWWSDPPLKMPPDRLALLHSLKAIYESGPNAKRSWQWLKE